MATKKKNETKTAEIEKTPEVVMPSGDFVTVKSKLPSGLSFAMPDGKTYVIRGMNQSNLVRAGGLIGMYQTSQLPAHAWAYFCRVYADAKYLKNKIIFADTNSSRAEAIAQEIQHDSSTKTGFEQVDPNSLNGIKTAQNEKSNIGIVE